MVLPAPSAGFDQEGCAARYWLLKLLKLPLLLQLLPHFQLLCRSFASLQVEPHDTGKDMDIEDGDCIFAYNKKVRQPLGRP